MTWVLAVVGVVLLFFYLNEKRKNEELQVDIDLYVKRGIEVARERDQLKETVEILSRELEGVIGHVDSLELPETKEGMFIYRMIKAWEEVPSERRHQMIIKVAPDEVDNPFANTEFVIDEEFPPYHFEICPKTNT